MKKELMIKTDSELIGKLPELQNVRGIERVYGVRGDLTTNKETWELSEAVVCPHCKGAIWFRIVSNTFSKRCLCVDLNCLYSFYEGGDHDYLKRYDEVRARLINLDIEESGQLSTCRTVKNV